MLSFFTAVFYGVVVALLFSLAIFIHEFGHYLAARWLGLKVDAFSIGFGPAIWKKTVNGIEYKICCIPFGGYVALPQLDPSGMQKIQGDNSGGEDENGEPLPDIAPWKRILVAFAGPLGNVVLAVFLAFLLFLVPAARMNVTGTEVGSVLRSSKAYERGLRVGDRIETVNGVSVETWSDLRVESMLAGDQETGLFGIVRPDGTRTTLELPFTTNNVFGVKMLGGVAPLGKCVVTNVLAGSVAEKAGLRPDDELVTLNGQSVGSTWHFIERMVENGVNPVTLGVLRGREKLTFEVTPVMDQEAKRPLIGVMLDDPSEQVMSWMMYRNPWKQLKWDSLSVVRVLKALVTPRAKGERKAVAKNIGGPVTIVVGLYRSAKGSMWDGLGFLRMICMNLAILNLLPLPVLDGGHILFALYEILFRRKPHPKFVSIVTNFFAFLLIGLMLFLVFRDVLLQRRIIKAEKALEEKLSDSNEAGQGSATNQAPASAAPAQGK